MMLRLFVRTSRPRFWIYALGPFLVGSVAGADTVAALVRPEMAALAVFFTLPANLLIYGLNDIFDYETDVLNARKGGYESRVPPDLRRPIALAILISTAPFLPIIAKLPAAALWAFAAFALASAQYSAPPLRAKARPFLDCATNVLYVLPGLVGFYAAGGSGFPTLSFLTAWLWCAAMHVYSAVPDIEADRRAGIATTATFLGAERALFFCLALWGASAALAFAVIGWWSLPLVVPYAWLGAISLRRHRDAASLHALYARFPAINAAAGLALFWIAASKFL